MHTAVRLCRLMCGKALPFRKVFPLTSPRLSLGETFLFMLPVRHSLTAHPGGEAEEAFSINYSSNQVVLLCLGDDDLYQLAWDRDKVFRRIIDKNTAIDIRRLGFQPALP